VTLIHIGYHKTASSWLQHKVFADERAGFLWVGRDFEARKWIVRPNALDFDPATVRARYVEAIEGAEARGLVPVLSDERFSGNPHSGGFDSKENADRLARIFPDAAVLIVIRRQQEMLYSCYDQYVNVGGACSAKDYMAPRTRYNIPTFRLEHFRYHRLIEYYQRLFGPERVLVLAFGMLAHDSRDFLERIRGLCGSTSAHVPSASEKVNVGRPPALIPIQRRLNPFLVRDELNGNSIFALPHGRYYLYPWLLRLARLVPGGVQQRIKSRIRSHIDSQCRGQFGQSNRETVRLTGLELKSFGYDLD